MSYIIQVLSNYKLIWTFLMATVSHLIRDPHQELMTLPFIPTLTPLNTLLRTETLLYWTRNINDLKGASKKPSMFAGKPSLNEKGGLRDTTYQNRTYVEAVKKISKRLSPRDNPSPSRITEPEEDHPTSRSISDKMRYSSVTCPWILINFIMS